MSSKRAGPWVVAFLVGFTVSHRSHAETGSVATLLPPYHLRGCLASYSTATIANVTAGAWMDSTNTVTVTGFPATSPDLSVVGAGGLDQFVAVQTGSNTSTTITASASIIGNFNSGALTGTMSSSGTTVTGTGTKFLSELANLDMIGNGTRGYSVVRAIASDTSLTIDAAFPASAASGDTMSVYYVPTIQIGATAADKRLLTTISADGTSIVVDSRPGGLNTHGGGTAITIGVAPNITGGNGNMWTFLWARTGVSGTTTTWSVQRITPYALAGYTTAIRRIGAVPIVGGNATATLGQTYQQQVTDFVRDTYWQESPANSLLTLTASTTTSWGGSTSLGGCVPPTSTLAWITFQGGSTDLYVRPRAIGSSGVKRPFGAQSQGGTELNCWWVQTDAAQCLEFIASSGTPTATIWVGGYREDMTR